MAENKTNGTNKEVYAEVYLISDEVPHYILPNKAYGQTLPTQIGSRVTRGPQAIPAYTAEGKLHYLLADNISYLYVKHEKDTDLVDTIVNLYKNSLD